MTPGTPPARIVLDTNLLVAALFRPSAAGPAGVIRLWESGRVRVCLSQPVLAEMKSTLGRLPAMVSARREGVFRLLENPDVTDQLADVPDSGWRCADPSDDKFLHLALAAQARALITSDRALLEVKEFPIPIVESGQWLRRARR